jgi:hypothetical protein
MGDMMVRKLLLGCVVALAGVAMVGCSGPSKQPQSGVGLQSSPGPSTGATAVDPRTVDLRSATFDIPALDGYGGYCPGGSRQFANGSAVAKKSDNGAEFDSMYTISGLPAEKNGPWDPHAEHVPAPWYGDIDGEPGDEALVIVGCHEEGSINPELLLALKVMPDRTVRTLGPAIVTPGRSAYDFDADDVRVENRIVNVPVYGDHTSNGGPLNPKQTRGYRYDNGQFSQVSGPITWPPHPKTVHDVDFRNTTINLAFGTCNGGASNMCVRGAVAIVDGTGHDTTEFGRPDGTRMVGLFTYALGKVSFVTGASGDDIALVTISQTSPDGSARSGVFSMAVSDRCCMFASPVAQVGIDGVTAITDQRAEDGTAKITVRTATGEEIRTYREQSTGQWSRVS